MERQSKGEYLKACNEYLQVLNKVNLLLVKEHTYLSEKEQYQHEISLIEDYILQLEADQYTLSISPAVQREHDYLQKTIGQNNLELQQLRRKLDTKESLITQLNSLRQTQEKYLRLLSSQYQSSLQQKLSMIRGKVDDLKKKIKQINKDILSLEQEHKQMVDDYSYRCNTLTDYKTKNNFIRQQIDNLKTKLIEHKKAGFRY